jgi:hypothetical protein
MVLIAAGDSVQHSTDDLDCRALSDSNQRAVRDSAQRAAGDRDQHVVGAEPLIDILWLTRMGVG